MGELQPLAQIQEFTIAQSPRDIAEKILLEKPKILGLGVYIWNTQLTHQVITILKKVEPDLVIVLGGPEVSYETESQPICRDVDYVIRGEADFEFYSLCKTILDDPSRVTRPKVIQGQLPEIKKIALPYSYYSEEDIKNRTIYVEASRGCPYRCEYCLSSLDQSVRNFDLNLFLGAMENLIQRGARSFKFVDRTFNLSISSSTSILKFFLERIHLGLFLHFEMVPDRLPNELQELIRQFPAGALQFEIGIQTWSPEVAKLVSRRQNYEKIKENFKFLTQETGVHIHADLIVGLPGETVESFALGFDEVTALGSHEVQVGILKRLKGTPIIRHDSEWEMIYQEHPPFQVLQTKTMSFQELQKMNRFAQFWDSVANSGNFKETIEALQAKARSEGVSFFKEFFRLSEFLSERHPIGNGIALLNLVESVWTYLTTQVQMDLVQARALLIADYAKRVKRDIPRFLRDDWDRPRSKIVQVECAGSSLSGLTVASVQTPALPKRQSKHWSSVGSLKK